jgi:hypothetical protein
MPKPETLIHELEEALSNGSDERRTKTLQRITDLFVFGSGIIIVSTTARCIQTLRGTPPPSAQSPAIEDGRKVRVFKGNGEQVEA